MVSPSRAKTMAEKNAVRVRNSIARSLRATSQDARSRPGSTTSGIGGDQLAIGARVRGGIERGARLVPHETAAPHDGRVRGEREPFTQVVGDEQQRRAAVAPLGQRRRE